MQQKIVPYGETHPVEVLQSSKNVIIVRATDNNEAYGLAGHGLKDLPKEGDKGKIVFEKGGPLKGYWQYCPAENSYMEKTVQEKNEVIADFMGLYPAESQGFGLISTRIWYDKATNIRRFDGEPNYDSDWNTLMEAVENIEAIADLVLGHFIVDICGDECIIYHYDFNWANAMEFIKVKCGAEKKKAVFEAVYACIETMKEQTK